MSGFVIGIDIGSSSCKIGLFNEHGEVIKFARKKSSAVFEERKLAVREYNPNNWWDNCKEAISQICSSVKKDMIVGIGLTGQIGTHILLDKDWNLLFPAISWQDGRASAEAKWLSENVDTSFLDKNLGMHLPPGTAWPIPRLLWLKKEHPELIFSNFRMMQPKDFIAWKLTGRFVTDYLSLRGLLNPQTGKIPDYIKDEVLKISDLENHLPTPINNPASLIGYVTKAVSDETGIPVRTPVFLGCGDFHCSLIGSGIVNQKFGFNITGTSDHIGVLVESASEHKTDPRVGWYPAAVENFDIVYGATSAGGGSVDWFLNSFLENPSRQNIGLLIDTLLDGITSTNGLLYLPYINGERAPIWDSEARGVFFGFGSSHKQGHFLRAILEGVSFSLLDCWRIIQTSEKENKPIIVSGAASGNSTWNQIKSDMFGVPFYSSKCTETTCLGAAILAAKGCGLFGSIEEAVSEMTQIGGVNEPNQQKKKYYEDLFGVYKELYPKLKSNFETIAEIRSRI